MRDIEIRDPSWPSDSRELEIAFTAGNHTVVEGVTYRELVELHHQITLHLRSVKGALALRERGITYRVKISTAPERHPEWEAAR